MRQLLLDFAQAVIAISAACIAYGFVDYVDQESKTDYSQFVAESCLPKRADERAIAVIEDGKLRCTIVAKSAYGKAPMVISAAVMERP